MTGNRRRPMRRIGDLLPQAASALGLEEELRLARAMSAWERLVAEHLPVATGSTHLIGLQGDALLVSATTSALASELRLRSSLLLAKLAAAPGGVRARELRVIIRGSGAGRDADPRV
ncbi:MAG: DciA family protein [Chloroflexi bacterium]|nr:DciA family protein [Chloroflexota bacterium]